MLHVLGSSHNFRRWGPQHILLHSAMQCVVVRVVRCVTDVAERCNVFYICCAEFHKEGSWCLCEGAQNSLHSEP